ncbi:MAG: DUF5625 family protein [Campylobacteraceae bacterium]|jgi:hypothetical protein|nr:DUF5625 family protein [Campylobacteraceae bacterium]
MKKILKAFFLAIGAIGLIMALLFCFAMGFIKELDPFRIAARLMGPPMPPYLLAIDLSKSGNVYETDIRIYDEGLYDFDFKFIVKRSKEDGGADRAIVSSFTGNPHSNGTMIPVKLSIYKLNKDDEKERIIDDIYHTNGRNGSTSNSIIRRIKPTILNKGIYQVRLETLEDFEFLVGREIYLEIRKWNRK